MALSANVEKMALFAPKQGAIILNPNLAWLISFGLASTPLMKFESDVKQQFKKGYITDPFTMLVNCEWNNGEEKNFRNDVWNMLQLIVYSISLGKGSSPKFLSK